MPKAPTDKKFYSPQELREAFSYDPETGVITRNHDAFSSRAKAGDVAVYREAGRKRGLIRHHGKRMLSYRVAWAIHYGAWPEAFLDHINGDESDDRIANLREATHAENMRNRKTHSHSGTGVKGVFQDGQRFGACISVNGVRTSLGGFSSIAEASAAYTAAANLLHGEFARHKLPQIPI